MKRYLSFLLGAALVMGSCAKPFEADSENSLLGDAGDARSLSAAPIQLVSAKSRLVNLGHVRLVGVVEGAIEVANFSSTKSVIVHYSVDNGVWKDATAYYQKSLPNGREIWSLILNLFEIDYLDTPPSSSVQFAVKMIANGQTFWDNNSSADYKVSTRGTNQKYSNVALGSQTIRMETAHYGSVYPAGTVLSVELALKNLTYAKDVKLVYSTDDWSTVLTAPAYFESAYSPTLEKWYASPVISQYHPGSSSNTYAESVKFCISYSVNGATYWDNNGGSNYFIRIGEFQD